MPEDSSPHRVKSELSTPQGQSPPQGSARQIPEEAQRSREGVRSWAQVEVPTEKGG